MSSVEPTHGWPVVLYRARLHLRTRGLDPFQRVVLALAATDVRDPQKTQELTGLDRRFVEPLVEDLRGRGALDADGRLLSAGRRLLDDDGEEAVVDGFLARDGMTGTPLPGFWRVVPHETDRPPLLPVDLATTQPEDGEKSAWRQAIVRWQRLERETSVRTPFAADPARAAITGIRFLRDGFVRHLPVHLSIDAAGQPIVEGFLHSDLLTGRLERARPPAWVDLEEEARASMGALDRARANEHNQAEASRRLRHAYGEVMGPLEEQLREIMLLRVLAESQPSLGGAALTAYRKFSEVFAFSLSPERITGPAYEARARLPKNLRSHLQPDLEALAHPDALQLPNEFHASLGGLRKSDRRPSHGLDLVAWPFWHAVLDPSALESEALRSAAQRCPSLWLELDLLRREGNAGAHAGGGVVDPSLLDRLDETVRVLLEAVEAIPPRQIRHPRSATSGFPAAAARFMREAEAAAARAERDPTLRRAAANALWRAGLESLSSWQEPADRGELDAQLRGLPTGATERQVAVERVLHDLRPADDDGRGFELPRDFLSRIDPAISAMLRGEVTDDTQLLRPLLIAGWRLSPHTSPALKDVLQRRDPWQKMARLHVFHVAAVRSADTSASEWSAHFEQTRRVVESLWNSEE